MSGLEASISRRPLTDQLYVLSGLLETALGALGHGTDNDLEGSFGVRQTLHVCRALASDCVDTAERVEATQVAPGPKMVACDTYQNEVNELADLAEALFHQVADDGPATYALAKHISERTAELSETMDIVNQSKG